MSKSKAVVTALIIGATAPVGHAQSIDEITALNRLKLIKQLTKETGAEQAQTTAAPAAQPGQATAATTKKAPAPDVPRAPILRGINGEPGRMVATLVDPLTGAASRVRVGESTVTGCKVVSIATRSVEVQCRGARAPMTISYTDADPARAFALPAVSVAAGGTPTPTPGGPLRVGGEAQPLRNVQEVH